MVFFTLTSKIMNRDYDSFRCELAPVLNERKYIFCMAAVLVYIYILKTFTAICSLYCISHRNMPLPLSKMNKMFKSDNQRPQFLLNYKQILKFKPSK